MENREIILEALKRQLFSDDDFFQTKDVERYSLEYYTKNGFLLNEQVEQIKRYKNIGVLGSGGMGVVQLVLDLVINREVAKKEIFSLEDRLQREAYITAILEHPSIVTVYDMEKKPDGRLYFTMKRVDGETLQEFLKKKSKRLEWEKKYIESQILSIFFKICDAIEYAHSKKIIHRDLKPDNVMLEKFGGVYVIDWGIAKIPTLINIIESESLSVREKPKIIGRIGTPGYMPPEQEKDASNVTEKADIYSLGKILSECFKVIGFIPKDIQDIINKATRTLPEERYETVKKFQSDIKRYQEGKRISARTSRTLKDLVEQCYKFIMHNIQKIVFIGSGALFVIISFLIYEKFDYNNSLENNRINLKEWFILLKKSEEIQIEKKDEFIIDITKMQQKEILEDLNEELKKATIYFTQVLSLNLDEKYEHSLKNGEFPKLSEEEKKKFEEKIGKLSENLKLEKIKDDRDTWKFMFNNKIFSIKKEQNTLNFYEPTDSILNNFYGIVVEAIGKIEDPNMGKPLLDSLKAVAKKFLDSTIDSEEALLANNYFMVKLVEALENCKAKNIAIDLAKIRLKIGQGSIFWNNTESTFKRILLINRG